MKRISLAVLFLGLTLTASSWAAAPARTGSLRIHLEGGYGFPQAPADYSDFHEAGLGVGGGIETDFRKGMGLGLDMDYSHHALDQDRALSEAPHRGPVSGVIFRGGSSYVLTTMAALRLDIPIAGRITPYCKLGAGFGHVSEAAWNLSYVDGSRVRDAVGPGEIRNGLASSVALGLRERAPGARFGYDLEVRSVWIAAKNKVTRLLPIRAGFHFGF